MNNQAAFLQAFLEENNLQTQVQEINSNTSLSKREKRDRLRELFQQNPVSPELTDKIEKFYQPEDGVNPLQVWILNLKYDTFKGKMGVGKIYSGEIKKNMEIALQQVSGGRVKGRVTSLLVFDGLDLKEVESAQAGEIVIIAGIAEVGIGDTITAVGYNYSLPKIHIDEPTIQMTFGVNTSPMSGREGKFTTSRQIYERLQKELETNVALKVQKDPNSSERFIVSGRGELHLSVLIETMRREGFELEISRPQVIWHTDSKGQKLEPFELLEVDVPTEYQGVVMQELGRRSATILDVSPNETDTEIHFAAKIPTRALIGLKTLLITSTKGTVIMHSVFDSYQPDSRVTLDEGHGSLVSTDTGEAMSYALNNAQQRGVLFILPGVEVYQGMVIGQCSRNEDLEINPCKGKQLTNVRSKSSDDALTITPPRVMSLENCIEYIGNDELLEVTPINLRIRKQHLNPSQRKKNKK